MIVVQVEKIEPMMDDDGNPQGYGEGPRWTQDYRFEGRVIQGEDRIKAGSYDYFKAGFQKPPQPGDTETFELKLKKDGGGPISFPDGTHSDGSKLWRRVVGRPKQGQGGGTRSNTPQNAQRATQSHASGGGQAKAVPTMSEALTALGEIQAALPEGTPEQATTCFIAWEDTGINPKAIAGVMRECIAAIGEGGHPAHATALFLGRVKGKIRKDLSPEEIAKAAAKKGAEEAREQAVKDGATEIQLAPADGKMSAGDFAGALVAFIAAGATAQALAGMGTAPVDDDIPF